MYGIDLTGTEHPARTSPSTETARATSRAPWAGVAVTAFVVLMFLVTPVAEADSSIGGETGSAAGQLAQGLGLAVSPKEGGDIYVVDADFNQRVDQFTPAGGFVRAFGWGIVPGAAAGTGDLTEGSAIVTDVTTTSGAFSGEGVLGGGKIISGPGIPPGTTIKLVGPLSRPNEEIELPAGVLELSNPAEATEAAAPLTVAAGPGNVPTDERQQLTVTAGGGTFALTFESPKPDTTTETTSAIAFDAPAAGPDSVQGALEGLSNIGPGNVAVGGSPGGPYTVEFTGRFADVDVRALSVADLGLSGGTPTSEITVTTPRQGGGALETCTTVCAGESLEEGSESFGQGSEPGQLRYSDAIAVDDDEGSGSYGDVYVVDQRNFRVEKYSAEGEFLLMFGGDVDKTTGADLCTAEDIEVDHDLCGAGIPGTGPAHFYAEEPPTQAGGGKAWSERDSNSIAVGPDGTVYVGDFGRVQEFEPDGVFVGEFAPPLEGRPPQFVTAVAVDSSGDLFERSRISSGQVSEEIPGVREFGPSHTLLRTFADGPEESGSEPRHIALDGAGDLFVSESSSASSSSTFRAFKPTGNLFAEFASDQVESEAHGIAIGVGALYATAERIEVDQSGERLLAGGPHVAVRPVPEPGPPLVSGERATAIEPKTATLDATVDPRQFATGYRFEYTTGDFTDCGTPANPACSVQPEDPVGLGSISREDAIQVAISGLAPATVYHWRVLAESSAGTTAPEAEFETLPDVSTRDFTTQTVGPELVTLKAELDPNNGGATEYTIRYGESESYGGGTARGTLSGVGDEFEPVAATFGGLRPNTTYHYQLAASNSNGILETGDQTFTTEPSAAEERAAEACPNTLLREENDSLALPDCRAYEQVSPAFKNGYRVNPANSYLSADGEDDFFNSVGSFSGSEQNRGTGYYLARRTSTGWLTGSPIGPPRGPDYQPSTPFSFDAGLDTSLFTAFPASSSTRADAQPGLGDPVLYLGHPDGSYLPASPPLAGVELEFPPEFWGQSSDLSAVILGTRYKLLPSDPRRDTGLGPLAPDRYYEISGVGGPDPTLSLAVEIPPNLPASCQFGPFGQRTSPLSADGSTLFYEAPLERVRGAGCGFGRPNPYVLYARTGEAAPIELSVESPAQCSSPHPCAGAPVASPAFDGTSPHGDLAWFTTPQPLVDSDSDAAEGASANDLYLAKLEGGGGSAELVQASHGEPSSDPTPGEGAGVKGVVRVSSDGTRAAFVATGVLTTEPDSAGAAAVRGADNLYLYDAATGKTKFVADLCTGPARSGSGPDPACPLSLPEGGGDSQLWTTSGLELPAGSQAHLTPDGHYLLFASYGRLAPGDTDSARDVYRYDFADGRLIRLSFGRDGNDGNGNDDAYDVAIPTLQERQDAYEMAEDGERAISADGSVAIFETFASLSSRDTNLRRLAFGAQLPDGGSCQNHEGCLVGRDVYEWEEDGHGTCRESGGCIRLISSGTDAHDTSTAVISSAGRDITFITSASLAPGDTDGVGDVYDAREAGGFPPSVPLPACGGAETCPGPAPGPSLHPAFTSEETHGTGNPPRQLRCAKGKVKVKRHGHVRCVAKKHHKDRREKKHLRKGKKHHRRAAGHEDGGAR